MICLALAVAVMAAAGAVRAEPHLTGPWPSAQALNGIEGVPVTFASRSPFTLADVGGGNEVDPPTTAHGTLFLPKHASADRKVPAVVLLHGASGVRASREMTYGRQFAELGVAALVVDVFAARRDRARGFIDRLIEITEAMALADAYAGLRYLDGRPEVDGANVALMGFSYGGMTTVYAAYAQVAESYAPGERRFVAHVAFYGPCIARFRDSRATGAPVLMLMGSADEIMAPDRCAEIARDLRQGGAQSVDIVVYDGAYHMWDIGAGAPRRLGRSLAPCSFTVGRDGVPRESLLRIPLSNPFWRKVMLGLCSDSEGYMIGGDDAVRAKSNAAVGRFLARAFGE